WDLAELTVLAPVDDRTEVWACGVTYETSREARVEESEHAPDIYARVYDAERPELFFKSAAWRVAGSGQPIAVRDDSTVSVPEAGRHPPRRGGAVHRHLPGPAGALHAGGGAHGPHHGAGGRGAGKPGRARPGRDEGRPLVATHQGNPGNSQDIAAL